MNLFRWRDFLTFGGLASFVTVGALYVHMGAAVDDPNRMQGIALMWVVALMFWAGYIAIVLTRKKLIDSITFTTKHNIYVIAGDFKIKQSDVEEIADNTISNWQNASNWYGCHKAVRQGLFLIIKPYPIKLHARLGKVAGYTIGKHMVVGYKQGIPLARTAIAHELGHVIHREWKGYLDEAESHSFMKKHKLP